MAEEISDEELEARMRRKLLGGSTPKASAVLSDDDRRMTEKLLGRDNTARLTRNTGERKFRPQAVLVHFEFYWQPSDQYRPFPCWHINRVENGRPEDYRYGDDAAELRAEIAALRKKGHQVRELQIGIQRRSADRKLESHRKGMLKQIGSFRL
ncbi:MAG: hypothetical protein H0T56_11130 [Pseudaminobacter sp.]|nr:hypothetical protein [Pseudaminobacter sp.]